jgi:branched-chain amino acid transport system ATP-binding protein
MRFFMNVSSTSDAAQELPHEKPLLRVEKLTRCFGGLVAVDDVSLNVWPEKITALIGPNGAGKTTLFNCLTGFYKPTSGSITAYAGGRVHDLARLKTHEIGRKARLARTFQNIRLFKNLSVLENCLVAQHDALMKASMGGIAGLFGFASFKRAEKEAVDLAAFWLEKLNLLAEADSDAGSLPYGAQRRLEIARALCLQPNLLCLDEPAAGLNPKESSELAEFLQALRDEHKLTVFLIEHDMSVVMGISDHIVVLDHGQKIAEGTGEEVRRNPEVIKAYLGEEDA